MPQLYRSFLQLPDSLLEESHLLLPDELTLQSHWFNSHFGLEFYTTDGQKILIKQLGFWNRSAGPDFLHCAIEIDGEERLGAIELDHGSQHWNLHGHSSNPAFEDVILHVVFEPESETKVSFTKTQSNKFVPKVIIPESHIRRGLSLSPLVQTTAHLGRCSTPFKKADFQQISNFLKSAALHRISQKNFKAQQTKLAHGHDQSLWIQIAETLGYKANSMAFTMLAQRLNINKLKKLPALEIQAIIFGTAGFLHPDIHTKAPADSQTWLEQLWDTWWQNRQNYELSPDRSIKWSLAGIRPTNHPQRRLAALAQIAIQWNSISSGKSLEALKQQLLDLADDFWNHHYTLTSKRSDKFLRLIGEDRINDLFINHLLPAKVESDQAKNWGTYANLKAPALSEKVNRSATRLLGDHPQKDQFLKKYWHHQALLQIYQDFCLQDTSNCQDCPFPEQLSQWIEQN